MKESKVFRDLAQHKPRCRTTRSVRRLHSAVASISASVLPLALIPVTHRSAMETDLFPLHDLSYNLLNFLLFRTHSLRLGLS